MRFSSKFDIGDTVYFYDVQTSKMLRGKIGCIIASASSAEDVIYNYYLHVVGDQLYKPSVPESLIFKERDDILDFAAKLVDIV